MVDGGAVIRAEGVEQGAQHTALWGAGAEAEGRGCVMAHSNPLAATRQEAVYPPAGGVSKSQVPQFVHQFVGEDGVEIRAVVYEEHPHVAPLLLQVGQCSMEGCGYSVLSRSVRSISKLVGDKTVRYE